ncbi:phage tail spike protein [Enterococcus raffinosus]|uniref:Phage minor structural protein n=1 Tax=Enterococcus raffinosus ATCC 49464 TaxID=1158602 RepID=R2RM77_9ENTE|nr:phage minor structural protein [Enterococcus raffinosus ATCC 49464]EOT75752.1 phage minor structural protein [Enterococcus raffinosus ATCC 49464]
MKPRIYEPTEKDFSHNGLGVLSEATRADVREAANGVYELEVEHPLKSRFKKYFENGYQIKAKPNDQEDFHVFEIKRTYEDTNGNNILIYAQSRTYKLGNREVQHVKINSQNGSGAMKAITAGMDERSDIELFSDIQTVSSTVFEARNVLNCIAGEQGSLLQYWGGEIKREPFRLSLLRRRGRDNVGTVRYGKDLQGLKITFDWQSIVTRCLPYADLQDTEDGQTKRIYGKKVDSDLIKNYPDVYAKHVQFTEEQGVKDQASLDKAAAKYFISVNPGCDKPKVSVELEFEKLTDSEEAKEFARLRNYGLFDTFFVYHKLYDIHVETKITEVLYDSLNEKVKKISAGDAQIAFYKQQNYEFQETIKTLTKKGYMSDFLDYVTNLINGVEGGSVLQYPKNKPHSTYYLDTDSRETAKDVVVLNNQGIGFSRTGWLGPFVNAWGINGDLNADFIRVGRIRAKMMETSFNGVGDTLKLVGGLLQVYNKEKRIMELSKKGMEFWSDKGSIGTIGTTDSAGNPFSEASTPTPIPDNALVIRTEGDGKYILISPNKGKGFVMLANGTTIHFGDMNIQGKVQIYKDVDIKGKLTLGGREVFPGQGGGSSGSTGGQGNGWNGQYPPEVQTDAEKFAWQAWVMLLSLGYSQAAAAGILGNINGEAGPSMNPDTDQIGGPAYGAIQFDGSAYPLVPPATYNGRVYVQNLMRAAGITDDYRTMAAQMRLVDWANSNGQWIGKVAPTTVAGYKALSDPSQAAYAFENNFERPATAHPDRQGYAVYWYNKFKDLKIPQANSDIVSVAKSLLGYFTYQLIHGEAYIGSVANPDRNGVTDCSRYVWLVLAKAGYRVPANMQWYTGSMTADARGAHQWLQEIAPEQSKAGDIIIYNVGGGAGANGHTAILLEPYRGNDTQIIQMGGDGRFSGVNTSTMGYSFGSLLGGDRCIARAVK